MHWMLPECLDSVGSLLSDSCCCIQIVAVPEGMSKGGKGPLLACNNLDLDILWGRLSTIEELAKSMRETIRVEVHGCVERGLLITLFGIRGFVPISHVKKEEGQEWLAKSDLEVCHPPFTRQLHCRSGSVMQELTPCTCPSRCMRSLATDARCSRHPGPCFPCGSHWLAVLLHSLNRTRGGGPIIRSPRCSPMYLTCYF